MIRVEVGDRLGAVLIVALLVLAFYIWRTYD